MRTNKVTVHLNNMLTLAFDKEVIGIICCGLIDDNVPFLEKCKTVKFDGPSSFKS
jgi:hypothetical protein